MTVFLLLLTLFLNNGDFSQGLKHWNADAGWSVKNKVAQLEIDNRAGEFTRGANLCSEPVALQDARQLRGAADVWTQRASRGYVFVGVRWYDRNENPLWTEMHVSNEGKANRTWQHLTFATQAPKAARFVSFCFFAGGYAGEIYRARADNARLE